MDYYFTQNELYWLDHLLPDATRRKKEDDGEDDDDDDEADEDKDESFGEASAPYNSKSYSIEMEDITKVFLLP